jgi:hypothetical protein
VVDGRQRHFGKGPTIGFAVCGLGKNGEGDPSCREHDPGKSLEDMCPQTRLKVICLARPVKPHELKIGVFRPEGTVDDSYFIDQSGVHQDRFNLRQFNKISVYFDP